MRVPLGYKKIYVKACGLSEYDAPEEFVEKWVDEETYNEMMAEELNHCEICGNMLDDEDERYCDCCKRKYYSIDQAIKYQNWHKETETIEVPILWTFILSDTEMRAELEKAFYRAVELEQTYLPKKLQKAAKKYMEYNDFEDWAKDQERKEIE